MILRAKIHTMIVGLLSVWVAQAGAPPGPPPGGGPGGPPGGAPAGGGGPPGFGPGANVPQPRNAQEGAPIDFTGTWVSVLFEDWRYRMVVPIKGDYTSVPLTSEGERVADQWSPEENAQCKPYGAAALMRQPGRVRISWQDSNTLKVEADAGAQTRILHFAPPTPPILRARTTGGIEDGPGRPRPFPPQPGAVPAGSVPTSDQYFAELRGRQQLPSLQGFSRAEWERRDRLPMGIDSGFVAPPPAMTGSLKVNTNGLLPGYLRTNGIPYSANTTMSEYYDYRKEPNGDEWMTVITMVEDPLYLADPWVTSTDFKKEPDDKKWHPTPCATNG